MIIHKKELVERIKQAKKRVRILGVLPFSLDWNDFKGSWYEKINKAELSVEIVREAEHFVNGQAIIASDKRSSGEERSYEFGSFLNKLIAPDAILRKYLSDKNCRNLEPVSDMPIENQYDYRQCFSLRTCYLQIPIPAINIDDDYFITLALTKFIDVDDFEQIDINHQWYDSFYKYFYAYFDSEYGARKYSTEITKKGNRLEVIQSFNEKRIPTGLLPRDSFLSTVHVKLVVWALIFTRDGKLLIHKRKENAKDNRGMWDKSVGGHVSIDDIDTVKAVARELAEELYRQEKEAQGGHDEIDNLKANMDKMIFLGEWLPNRRYTTPFSEINRYEDESYYFRMDYPFSANPRKSERYLTDETVEDVSVFADVYVCIAAKGFNTDKLKNSDYAVLDLFQIKDAYNEKKITYKKNGEAITEKFEPTPDLKSIIRSSLWDELSSFSDYVKENYGGHT